MNTHDAILDQWLETGSQIEIKSKTSPIVGVWVMIFTLKRTAAREHRCV
jgi:hypothetical protein